MVSRPGLSWRASRRLVRIAEGIADLADRGGYRVRVGEGRGGRAVAGLIVGSGEGSQRLLGCIIQVLAEVGLVFVRSL